VRDNVLQIDARGRISVCIPHDADPGDPELIAAERELF
jgi:hypothetical protein